MFLGLGSNVGDRLKNLQAALRQISKIPSTYILDYSSIYETAPVGYLQQDFFLNMAVRVSTRIPPLYFLSVLQGIEKKIGRVREIKWGPRIIDIDILYWGEEKIRNFVLTVPHPENQNREFVKIPMNELAPGFMSSTSPKCIDLSCTNDAVTDYLPKSQIEF